MTLNWSSQYAPVDGDFSDVSLLLLGEGTNGSTTILDSSSNNNSVSVNGDAQISTAVNTPFGTGDGVLAFDGTGDYLTMPSSTDWTLGSSGDFTIECWIYPNGSQGTNAGVVSTFTDWNSYQNRWAITINNLTLRWYDSLGNVAISSSVLSTQWSHLAVSRFGSTVNLFVNGALAGTQTTNQAYTTQERLIVGIMPGQSDFNGYISNLRITKGVARYTSNFTPPTAPFPILSPSTRIEVGDGFDVEAANYILAVEAADNQALEDSVRTAINTFVVGCKSDGTWNAIKSSCIMAGARTLDGALVPLKGTAPTNNNFVAGDYNRKTGLGNITNTTKHLDTNRSGTDDPNTNGHMAVYATSVVQNGAVLGYYQTSPFVSFNYLYHSNSGTNYSLKTQGQTSNIGTQGPAFYGVRKAGVTPGKLDARLNNQDYTATFADTASVALNYYVFARNFGGASDHSKSRLSFYSIGESLDLALLDNRISTVMTTLNTVLP